MAGWNFYEYHQFVCLQYNQLNIIYINKNIPSLLFGNDTVIVRLWTG